MIVWLLRNPTKIGHQWHALENVSDVKSSALRDSKDIVLVVNQKAKTKSNQTKTKPKRLGFDTTW
jgi:hypothetical protein